MTAKTPARTRRDRWADWAVVGVLVVALLFGWGVKTYAESQTSTFTDEPTDIPVQHPTRTPTPTQPPACSIYTNEKDCLNAGCSWDRKNSVCTN